MPEAALVVPRWDADQLKRGHTLHGFTQALLKKNLNRRLSPTRAEINVYWKLKVMEAFPSSDNTTRINLLEQACYLNSDRLHSKEVSL